jgi:hypothetical protein
MPRQRLVLSFLFVLLATTTARANTVEYVSLELTSDSTISRYSREHSVHDSRIQGFRLPFVGGEDHRVTIVGHLTDFLDRVQIVHDGRVTRTIQKEDLVFVGHTDEHGGKGKIVFDLPRQRLPGRDETFQIRIRFEHELAGFDKVDCKVVARGKITSAEWSDANGAELPEFEIADSGTPYDRLTRDHIYRLNLFCFKCPASFQLGDGINEEFFDQEVSASSLSVESLRGMRKKIGGTFRLRNQFGPGDVRDLVEFADAGVGNIEGGWGGYIYTRIEDENLPRRNAANPLRTDLQHVRARGFGTGRTGTSLPPPTSSSGCDNPAPSVAPSIESPRNGAVCVGSPSGTLASVNFEFDAVASACGRGAYQIEIQRLDANCPPVQWTGESTGFDNFDRCWIADLNTDFHSSTLQRSTQYRWRVRGNSTSTTVGAGPFSAFQTFTTGGAPAAPVFEGEPSEGGQVRMGNAVATTVPVRWRPSGCGQETFDIRVLEDNQQSAGIQGAGNTATIPIRRGHAYRIELIVTTNWGSSPMGTLRFSTIQ